MNDILDCIDIGIIKTNSKYKIEYINNYLKEYFSKDIKTIDELNHFFVHPDDKFKNIKEHIFISRLLNVQGAYKWFRIEKKLLTKEKSNETYIYTFHDIHEQKKLENNLIHERSKVEDAYKHKSSFLANISHEVRTPINGIIGMITLLEDTKLSDEQKSYLDMIKECSFNLMSIINDILDYSKLEAGKLLIDMKCMSLRKCIESTNDIILSKTYEKDIVYTYDIDDNIPEFIKGDSNRLKQIILNLLSNAFKFTDHGSIHLQIKKAQLEELNKLELRNKESDIFLKFSVKDTGCGIDEKDKEKLFQSFSQINNGTSTKLHSGTGLGLAICKELVTLMNGDIYLEESFVDSGSTFSFIIPTISCNIENEKINSNILQNLNILIVDDNLQNRMSLTAMVTKWGMKAHVFSNSQEALFYTKFQKFDIGLIDICMPKMDGKMLVENLSKNLKNEMFPVIALSSLGEKIKDNKHFKTVLLKPVKESKLREICIDLLCKSKENENQIESNLDSCSVNKDSLIPSSIYSEIKPNIRFLIAEDVYINQCVILNFLKKLGYINIEVVSNGTECLKALTEKEFDVLLLDIRMPGMNGDDIAKEITKYYSNFEFDSKYKFKNQQKPFLVAITAYCLKDDKEKYLGIGFDEYISKPIDINQLKISLDNAMQFIMLQ